MRLTSICLALSLVFVPTLALADERPATLSVTGSGTASAPPDIASVMTGVETFAETAAEALAQNSERMAQILTVLADAGIDAKDVQTRNLSVSARYADRKTRSTHDIAGYQVRNSVTVRIRDLAALGEVLDAIVRTGANRIDGVSFGFANPADLRREARRKAIADARTAAETYAEAAGVRLGDILSINDGMAGPKPMHGMAMAETARSAVPVATGESSISDTVRIVWELKQD